MTLSIGFQNLAVTNQIVAILVLKGAGAHRLKEDAIQEGMLIDATQGHKAQSLLVMASGHVMLSSVQATTLKKRLDNESSGT